MSYWHSGVFVLIASIAATMVAINWALPESRSLSALQIDGISLDNNAASVFSDGTDRQDHNSLQATDKMLHEHEAGELDGIALDNNAASILDSHRQSRLVGISTTARMNNKQKTNAGLPAHQLMIQGEADLSSGRYSSAIRLLRKARHLSGRASGNGKFAETLIKDIERAHPSSGRSKRSSSDLQHEGKSIIPKMHETAGMKWAAKKLSSGKEFRSLYGLMREKSPGYTSRTFSQQSSHRSSGLLMNSAARTTTLSEDEVVNSKVHRLVTLELAKAEHKLEARTKAVLEHEEENMIRTAMAVTQKARRSAVSNNAGQMQATPKTFSWPADQNPPSLKLSWSPTTQLADIQPPAPESINTMNGMTETPKVAAQKYFSSQAQQSQPLSGKAQPNSPVPIINLNLPPGEKLPPGRYALDGSVVPDAAGQLDFVGNLVRVSPPGVL